VMGPVRIALAFGRHLLGRAGIAGVLRHRR
jgi:hypothetical protein